MRSIRMPVMAVVATAVLGFGAPAAAQTEPTAAAEPAAAAAATTPAAATPAAVSDEQVRKYALALAEVAKVQQAYAPKVAAATEADKPAIEQEVNAKLSAAVEAQGLDARTFNAIGQSAQQDPALNEKIQAEYQKAAQPSQ